MDIREAVLREEELNKKIEFNIKELEMLESLSHLEKYKNSESLEKRFNKYYEETILLLKERDELVEYINSAEEVLEFAEEIAEMAEEEFSKELTEEEISLLKMIDFITIGMGE